MQHGEPTGGIIGLNVVAGLQYLIETTVMSWHSPHNGSGAVGGYRWFSKDRLRERGGFALFVREQQGCMELCLGKGVSWWVRKNILLKWTINKLESKLYMLPMGKSRSWRNFIVWKRRAFMLMQDVQGGACGLSQCDSGTINTICSVCLRASTVSSWWCVFLIWMGTISVRSAPQMLLN